jgi:hypothetical protein
MSEFVEPKRVYLEPICEKCESGFEDRRWCEDDVFDNCPECGKRGPEYILLEVDPKCSD